jgi:hypothetical protein
LRLLGLAVQRGMRRAVWKTWIHKLFSEHNTLFGHYLLNKNKNKYKSYVIYMMSEPLTEMWEKIWGKDFRYFGGTKTLAESYLTYLSSAREWILEAASRHIYKIVSNSYALQNYISWAILCPHLIDGFAVLHYLLRDENQNRYLEGILPTEAMDWHKVKVHQIRIKLGGKYFPKTFVYRPSRYVLDLSEAFEKTLNAIESRNDKDLKLAYFIGTIRAKEPWHRPECVYAARQILFYGLDRRVYERFISELISFYMLRSEPEYVRLLNNWRNIEMSLRAEVFLGSQI